MCYSLNEALIETLHVLTAAVMADGPGSTSLNENTNSCKRGGDFEDAESGFVVKKLKTETLSVENEKEAGKVDCKVEVSNQNNNTQVYGQNGCSQEKKSETKEHFEIEADAAEDKGSRHTMEDAWVVLPDASLEFPGKLR